MSALIDSPKSASYRNGRIYVSMTSGLDLSFPIDGNRRFEGQPAGRLSNIVVSPFGLHWPDLNEDLSIQGILSGDYRPRKKTAGLES